MMLAVSLSNAVAAFFLVATLLLGFMLLVGVLSFFGIVFGLLSFAIRSLFRKNQR
jgi:hypothetical protein